MSQTIVVFGANSAIAKEYTRLNERSSDNLILVARSGESLNNLKKDLTTRHGRTPQVIEFDFQNLSEIQSLVEKIFANPVDVALIAYGSLPDQEKCRIDSKYMQMQHQLNSTSIISLLSSISEKMKIQGKGTIAAITSVAGDRGKASNYYYGAAKASVSIFMQGLRQDFYRHGVHVVDVKPGFVDTPMTVNFDKGMLWAKPQSIAKGIDTAIRRKKNVVYLPFFWHWVMCVIRLIPESIFKRIKL